MYSYLLKYCCKKTCTHEYITSTTEYIFKFLPDRKKVNCFSGLPSSVKNAPHLSFFELEKKVASSIFQMLKSKYWHFDAYNDKKVPHYPNILKMYFTYQAFLG